MDTASADDPIQQVAPTGVHALRRSGVQLSPIPDHHYLGGAMVVMVDSLERLRAVLDSWSTSDETEILVGLLAASSA
jgi:hypothetical protein